MKTLYAPLCAFLVGYSYGANADAQMIRSVHELGDPNGYCLDIPGFGPRLQKDAPINTHTCKYSRPGFYVDELFEITKDNHFRMPEYDLCLAAGDRSAGAAVHTIDCASTDVHAWTMHSNARVTPSDDPDLCLTLSSDRRFVNSSVGNLVPNSTRAITLETCATGLSYVQSWRWSDPHERDTPNANTLRAGMDAAVAAKIRELGNSVNARETAELIATLPRMYTEADVTISEEISYGPNPAQRLQVYSGVNRNNPQNAAPVVLMVHGGGLARGGLQNFAAPATHLAALGYVVVNMTYPLTPEAKWPDGAQSVAAAVRWIKTNAKDIKANPDSIFVLGQSAGGALVANFVFRPSLIDGEVPAIAGAILASPAISLSPDRVSTAVAQYYGDSAEELTKKQVMGNVERTSIPVLILVAEFDPDQFHEATATLYQDLLVDKGSRPRIRQMRGHNHTSYIASIGTADTQAAAEIIDFMQTAGRD
ncbi:MAG: alpha/beta hydrolase fold domain-containing protein [Woeseiaceae bacterium]